MPLSRKNKLSSAKTEEDEVLLLLPSKNQSPNPQPHVMDSESITINLQNNVSVRMYGDTRPHCLETATLQKGLVLVIDGKELVEEGVGFGVPVVIYRDEPYFSSTAKCTVADDNTLVKSFVMDTISRKRLGEAAYVNDGMYSIFHKYFHTIYVRNTFLTPLFNKLIELTKVFGMNTEFVKVKPRGTVTIRYTCLPDEILVEASFDQLEKTNCDEIVLLSEQGAGFFRKYSDANGQTLVDSQIGAWMPINANEASLWNLQGTLGFSLVKVGNVIFFRGREKIRNRYSWVGLGYSFPPTSSVFRFTIRLNSSLNSRQM